MSTLLEKIRRINSSAAFSLEKVKFCTDAEIRTLTRNDLHELFPGSDKLKLRKAIFEKIHEKKSIQELLKDLQGFVPHDSLKAALTNNGVLVDYLHILKDMKTQLNNVQSFLDAHIGLLEDLSKGQPEKQPDRVDTATSRNQASVAGTPICGATSDASVTPDLTNTKYGQSEVQSQKTQTTMDQGIGGFLYNIFNRTENTKDSTAKGTNRSSETPPPVRHQQKMEVNYKMVVSGKTFDAHLQLLEQIKDFSLELRLVDEKENQTNGVKFVFCPVVSRVGSDVEAAMKDVAGSEPVILVLMHHSHEAKHVASVKTWAENLNIMLHVNVFYHESRKGLVQCKENKDAISAIRHKLLSFEKS